MEPNKLGDFRMLKLVILNIIVIIIDILLIILAKKYAGDSEKRKKNILLISALLTIVCHYSSLVYHAIDGGFAASYAFLRSNPNLVLPIYPCNVVMWCGLIFALLKKKDGKFGSFLCDYIFLFGVFSALVGMFANVDFINNPTLADYDVTKGIVAHGFMLMNILLVKALGYFEFEFTKNLKHILVSVIMMGVIGLYCNLLIAVICDLNYAVEVNSMFLIHSPFAGTDFLTYPMIAGIALIIYLIAFAIIAKVKRNKTA